MRVTVYIVNSFIADGSGGNPAGVVLGADHLSDKQMLTVARKVGLSETAFVYGSNVAEYALRFFTTTGEVDLCGHATIACWFLLRKLGRVADGMYQQETRAGLLDIETTKSLTFMQQPQPQFGETIPVHRVAELLSIPESSFSKTLKPQVVSTGLMDLIVVLNDKDTLHAMRPDPKSVSMFSRNLGVVGIHVTVMLRSSGTFATARNFAPLVGIDEESATGTSNGALLCYLKNHGVLPRQQTYRIEQGKAMGQTSHIFGKFVGNAVWVGGEAIIVREEQLSV